MTHTHFTSEGTIGFKSLIFVPGRKPYSGLDFTQELQNIKLYVKRVFITDSIKDFMPRYLNFVKGLVDSEDLPLHISRQDLQKTNAMNVIKRRVIAKTINMLKKLADEEDEEIAEIEKKKSENVEVKEEEKPKLMYTKFWKEYGKNIRLGILDDQKNRKSLIDLLRFYSNKSEKQLISLKQYVERMKENQKNIYYITGESLEVAKKSPFLEEIENRGFEVLYLVDPIDEYIIPHIPDYEKKPLQSISREGLELGDEEEKKTQFESDKKTFEPLTRFYKNLYPNILMKAEVSNRLSKSPLVLVAPKYGYSANMERIMRAQTMQENPDKEMPEQANRILEINPNHRVIIDLNQRIAANEKDEVALNMAKLLYETACLRSGYPVKNSAEFAQRVFALIGGDQLSNESETKDEL
jgi:HSP90 family molecular chaperone